jgi:hypothetical protein
MYLTPSVAKWPPLGVDRISTGASVGEIVKREDTIGAFVGGLSANDSKLSNDEVEISLKKSISLLKDCAKTLLEAVSIKMLTQVNAEVLIWVFNMWAPETLGQNFQQG